MKWLALTLFGTVAAWGSSPRVEAVVSARSGTINYIEGDVRIDDKPVEVKFAQFPFLKDNSVLRTTDEGRVEMLLGDGIFLRLAEGSAVRMVSSSLVDTRLELLAGSALIEWADVESHVPVIFTVGNSQVRLLKRGLYRLDTSPARVEVYAGEASVTRDGQMVAVKKARMLKLEAGAAPEKFDNKTGDSLFRWARRRAEYLAYANVNAAKNAARFGYRGGVGQGWVFDPVFGLITYMPGSGIYNSFWGYQYWSPYAIWVYGGTPSVTGGGSRGVTSSAGQAGMPATSGGTSSVIAPSSGGGGGSHVSPTPPPAPVSSGGVHGGTPRGH